MNNLIQSLPSPQPTAGNYSHMDGGIMDGRWRGGDDDDGDDLGRVPERNFWSPESRSRRRRSVDVFREIWRIPPSIFRSRALCSPKGSVGGRSRQPRLTRPRAHPWPCPTMAWWPRAATLSPLLAPWVFRWIMMIAIKIGVFPKVDFSAQKKTPGQFCWKQR